MKKIIIFLVFIFSTTTLYPDAKTFEEAACGWVTSASKISYGISFDVLKYATLPGEDKLLHVEGKSTLSPQELIDKFVCVGKSEDMFNLSYRSYVTNANGSISILPSSDGTIYVSCVLASAGNKSACQNYPVSPTYESNKDIQLITNLSEI